MTSPGPPLSRLSRGKGIEKIVRNEIFKEIWNEIVRIDQGVSATRFAAAQSSTAA
jgi:hypothetical protein